MELLQKIFNHDFSQFANAEDFRAAFFEQSLTLDNLKQVHDFMAASILQLAGQEISSAFYIGPKSQEKPFMLMAQLHGNEPAGLAGILYALALHKAGFLRQPVIAVIGNDLAAQQYFKALTDIPGGQESRDCFRRGISTDGQLLPDMNRIPNNFRKLDPASSHHAKRWHELDLIADNCCGILDIHSARGDLVCLTESSDNRYLKNSPIKNIMTGLTEAIGSATESSTFKTIAGKKANIAHQFGIEAGTHENVSSFKLAAEFTAMLLYNITVSTVAPVENNGIFKQYKVGKALKFSDLLPSAEFNFDEIFYTAKVIGGKAQIYQYKEREEIAESQLVAVSQPSGVELKAPFGFAGVFVAKSAEVYSDKAIGLYPVAAHEMNTKFCYPCEVCEVDI